MLSDAFVLDLLKDSNALLDSRLMGVLIGQEASGAPKVELQFRVQAASDPSEIRINFTEVIEFEICYEEKDEHLNIWDLEFLRLEDDSFYIALSPNLSTLSAADATDMQATDDFVFVRSRHIEAIVTRRSVGTTVHAP